MKILTSNDDGVDAPGIKALAQAMRELGDVHVIAPDRNRSGASNSLTISRPIRYKTLDNGWISVMGTPTDCTHLGLTGAFEEKPDIVVSGINAGANLADDVWYSGTVAAAMEARLMGYQSIAFSLDGEEFVHYQTAAYVAKKLVEKITKDPLPMATLLNVNVPDVPVDELNGFEITRLGNRKRNDGMIEQPDPRGRPMYWVSPPGEGIYDEEGTDFWAIGNKSVSITPLKVDITKYEAFEQLSGWVKDSE